MPHKPPQHAQLLHFLRQVDARLRRTRWLELLGLIVASLLGALLTVQLLERLGIVTASLVGLAAMALTAVGATLLADRAFRPQRRRALLRLDLAHAAAVADRRADLDDLLKTAYGAMAPPAHTPSSGGDLAPDWQALLLRRAAAATSTLDPRRIAPLEAPTTAWPAAVLLTAVALLFWLSPGRGLSGSPGLLETWRNRVTSGTQPLEGTTMARVDEQNDRTAAPSRPGQKTAGDTSDHSASTPSEDGVSAQDGSGSSSDTRSDSVTHSGDARASGQNTDGRAGKGDRRTGEGSDADGAQGSRRDTLDGAGSDGRDDSQDPGNGKGPTGDRPSSDNPDLMVMEVDTEAEPGSALRMRRVEGEGRGRDAASRQPGGPESEAGDGDDATSARGAVPPGEGGRGASGDRGSGSDAEDGLKGSAPGPQDGEVDPFGKDAPNLDAARQRTLLTSETEAAAPVELFSRASRRQDSELPYVESPARSEYLEAGASPAAPLPWSYQRRIKDYFLALAAEGLQ